MSQREPIFNVPGAVVALLVLLVAVHAGLALLPPQEELRWILTLGFIPARYSGLADKLPGAPYAQLTSFITHMLVHGDLVHLAMNSVWLLAFGGAVALRLGNLRFVLLVLLTAVAGALMFLAFNWGRLVPVVGASGAVSGLMAGAFRFFFSSLANDDGAAPGRDPRHVPLMSLREVLTSRACLTVMGFLDKEGCVMSRVNATITIHGIPTGTLSESTFSHHALAFTWASADLSYA